MSKTKAKDLERQFNLIVNTLVSTQAVDSRILRQHILQYALDAGVTYTLARQAVIFASQEKLRKRLETI